MSVSTEQAPTQRQLRYLRVLAANIATTFVNPRTRRDASHQIERLRSLSDVPRMQSSDAGEVEVEHLAYATAVHPDELTGHGSSARWRAGSPGSTLPVAPQIPPKGRMELARYTVSGGERVLYAQLAGGCVRVTDRPGSGAGRSYLVERQPQVDGYPALQALIADYLQQAHELDEVPMASGAVRQLFAQVAPDA
jgi:hypothetical protein